MAYPFDQPRYDQGYPVPEDYTTIALDTDIAPQCIGLWVGAAGNLAVTMIDGSTRTIVGVAAGTLIPGRFKQVNTGTTVAAPTTNILAARLIG